MDETEGMKKTIEQQQKFKNEAVKRLKAGIKENQYYRQKRREEQYRQE